MAQLKSLSNASPPYTRSRATGKGSGAAATATARPKAVSTATHLHAPSGSPAREMREAHPLDPACERGSSTSNSQEASSRLMTRVLRHDLAVCGLEMRPDCAVRVHDLLGLRLFDDFCMLDVESVLRSDAGRRFASARDELGDLWVRAIAENSGTVIAASTHRQRKQSSLPQPALRPQFSVRHVSGAPVEIDLQGVGSVAELRSRLDERRVGFAQALCRSLTATPSWKIMARFSRNSMDAS